MSFEVFEYSNLLQLLCNSVLPYGFPARTSASLAIRALSSPGADVELLVLGSSAHVLRLFRLSSPLVTRCPGDLSESIERKLRLCSVAIDQLF